MLDRGTEQLDDLDQQAEKSCGPFELEDPTEEEVAYVQRFVTKYAPQPAEPGRLTVAFALMQVGRSAQAYHVGRQLKERARQIFR